MNTDSVQEDKGNSWIGLINDSSASKLEEKFKSKLNFDRATVKLLPMLIKALRQNIHLQKILEDYSSSSPGYDGKVTTEFTFKRDIFLDSRKPQDIKTSRLYTIQYKTSPILFIRNPAKDLEYFKKTRKFKEYKIMIDYFNKVIREKVSMNSSNSILNHPDSQTESLFKKIGRIAERPPRLKKLKNFKKAKSLLSEKETKKFKNSIVSCNCPRHLSLLLNKIISSIQQIMPDVKTNKSKPCSIKRKNKSKSQTRMKFNTTTTQPRSKIRKPSKAWAVPTTKHKNKTLSQVVQWSDINHIFNKTDKTLTSTPANFGNVDYDVQVTTIKNHAEPTESYYRGTYTTNPISTYLNKVETGNNFITSLEKQKQENTTTQYPTTTATTEKKINIFENFEEFQKSNPSALKIYNHADDENDAVITTVADVVNDLKKYSTHGYELLKSNFMSPANRKNTILEYKAEQKDQTTTEMAVKVDLKNETIIKNKVETKKRPIFSGNKLRSTTPKLVDKYSATMDYEEFNEKDTTKLDSDIILSPMYNKQSVPTSQPNFNSMRNKIQSNKEKSKPLFVSFDNDVLEDEIEKIAPEDDYQQEQYKHSERPISIKNITKKMDITDLWKVLKSNNIVMGLNSMTPMNRPTYLQIHRNNWKHEDTNDYDTNIKSNMFDLS